MNCKPLGIAAWASPQPVLRETGQNEEFPSSAAAIAAAVKAAASTPVEFSQRTDKESKGLFSGPSAEYLELCQEQLAICDRMFGHNAKITVYIRTTDSYGTGRLELRRVAAHPKWMLGEPGETLVLIGNFEAAAHLHSAEAALSKQEALGLSEFTLVLPMVKDLFLVGVLVAEWMTPTSQRVLKDSKIRAVRPQWPPRQGIVQMQEVDKQVIATDKCNDSDQLSAATNTFTQEQQGESTKVARTLALACVMDQRTILLQQSSWQRGVRIGDLLEQIRGPLAAMRTLGKMLQPQLKRGEISSDVLEDMLVQGDRMKEVVQEFQEAFYFSQSGSNILNRGLLNADLFKTVDSTALEDVRQVMPGDINAKPGSTQMNSIISVGHSSQRDKEAPLPPAALAPLMHSEIESCDVYELLIDLVASGAALAHQRGQALELKEKSQGAPFLAAVNESSLRQALSNLLESSLQHTLPDGWVKVEVMQAPGGGVLVVIDDNGPDLSLMLQTQALAPLGLGLHSSAQGRRDANVLLNVGAELTIAQDIIEQWGGVLRITSPFLPKAPSGIGGTHLEVWLPAPLERDSAISHHESQQ